MHSSQFGITFTDSRGPVNSDGLIHCIRSLNRMVRYSVMPLPGPRYLGRIFRLSTFSIAVFRTKTRLPSPKLNCLMVCECSFLNQSAAWILRRIVTLSAQNTEEAV